MFQIGDRPIGHDQPPYIIAEISANHAGGIANALNLIEAAKKAGCDAVKIQSYRPESITIDCDLPLFTVAGGQWQGRRLFDLYKEAQTPFAWHPDLFAAAADYGITLFSSPFDVEAVDVLERLDCPAYKLASFEIAHGLLIERIAKTGKPVIVSTGMATNEEIAAALSILKPSCPVALLHCVSGYPVPFHETNLWHIRTLAQVAGCDAVGFSDHTATAGTSLAAVTAGAMILEKHFRMPDVESVDAAFSLTPVQMKMYVSYALDAWIASTPRFMLSAASSVQMKRSLFVVEPIKKGQFLTHDNVKAIRPHGGMTPLALSTVIGQRAALDLDRGTPLAPAMVDASPIHRT